MVRDINRDSTPNSSEDSTQIPSDVVKKSKGVFPSCNVKDMNKEQLHQFTAKGGKTVSIKQRISAKLRGMRMRKSPITDDEQEWVLNCLEDPNLNIFSMTEFLESKRDEIDPVKYVDLRAKLHKLMHGEKKQIDLSLSGNISVSFGGELNVDEYKPDMSKIIQDAEIIDETE